MKQILVLLLILTFASAVFAQKKTSGKVKRKYRDMEQVSKNLASVYIHGEIYDEDKQPLAGASVTIDGTFKGVNSNESGEFYIENLLTGKARIRISHIGYKTRTIDYELRAGENYYKIMLTKENIYIEPISVTAQKRDQQLLDVPAAITAISSKTIENLNLTELGPLSELVPGLYIREQGANRPGFVIRGLTSDEVSPSAQPRISTYFNNVPINRTSGASIELFDMEQVEVLKGPQNTLFGRGAQAGAVHFISKKPGNKTEGYVTAGAGSFAKTEIRAAVNVPLAEDLLFVRAAGIYNARNGYVENTFGGTLNGKNTVAGRFSLRFLPGFNHKFDIVVNYQKDDTPGIAFMSQKFPNTNGITDVFSGVASLEQGENLGTGKELFDALLNYRYYVNEHNFWSVISSYRKSKANARWDGDGTAAAAIDMAEHGNAEQYYNEIRYNFSKNSRLNGSGGASYWREKADQTYWFSPNEQNMFHLFFDPTYLVLPNGQPVPVPALPNIPQLGPIAGMPLPTSHQEENFSAATNQATEVFADGTYQLRKRIFVSAGIRGVFDSYRLSSESTFTGGSESVLGMLTGNFPNLFFKPNLPQEISKNTLSFTGRVGINYKINEYGNIFVNAARGRRPNVLQFTSAGEKEVLDAEILNNFDVGFKATILDRIFIDAVGFYQIYNDFQSNAWVAIPETGEFNYKTIIIEQAKSYGIEVNMKASVLKQLDIFGNYAWLHTNFNKSDSLEYENIYAGNTFRLSPEHSFTFGLNARLNINPDISFFVLPTYSYKTHFYFEDANTEGLEQEAYGLLNINAGLELADPKLLFSVYGTNLLDEKYLTSAGNSGIMFGVPTFVPGAPRMIGAKITWKF